MTPSKPSRQEGTFVKTMVELQAAVTRAAELKVKQYRFALLLVVAMGLWLAAWGFAKYQRDAGRTEERVTRLTHELRVVDTLWRVDTVRLAAAKKDYARAKADLFAVPLAPADSYRVSAFARAADAALGQCTVTVSDCARKSALADSLLALKMPKQRKWGPYAGVGVGAGKGGVRGELQLGVGRRF
jgi:hypothetical protein